MRKRASGVQKATAGGRNIVLSALALSVSLGATEAHADDGAELRSRAHAWFDGERRSGYLWGSAGLVSLGAAGALHRFGRGSDLERGMAYPLAAFGVLQTAIGLGSLLRSSARADDFDALVARSPEEARRSEIKRMRTVNGAFLAIEIVETALVVGGAAFAATRRSPDQDLARGVGLGLAMQGGLMLFLDALAAARGHSYAGQLDSLRVGATTEKATRALSVSGSF